MNDEKKRNDFFVQFAYRFDYDDGEYLKTNGYSHAEIDIKLRILKVMKRCVCAKDEVLFDLESIGNPI